jgi:hypothetical protein
MAVHSMCMTRTVHRCLFGAVILTALAPATSANVPPVNCQLVGMQHLVFKAVVPSLYACGEHCFWAI